MAIAAAIVLGAGLNLLPILHLSLLGALGLVLLGILTPNEAKDAIDFDVIVVIGAAFGLAAAVASSGLGEGTATLVADTLGSFGPQGAMAGIIIMTITLSSIITNNAAAALLFPIAISTAADFGIDAAGRGGGGGALRVGVLHDPHRLPDQPDGVRPGRVPLRLTTRGWGLRSRWWCWWR